MKKKALFTIFIALALFAGAFFGGCTPNSTRLYSVGSVEIKGYDAEIELQDGEYTVPVSSVKVSEGATYEIFTDREYKNPFNGADLGCGNTYYIRVKKGDSFSLYTIFIRLHPEALVVFYNERERLLTLELPTGEPIPDPGITPTRKGYTFAGWSRDLSLPLEHNEEIKALWVGNLRSITWDLAGGVTDYDLPSALRVGDNFPYADATREGYVFKGWYCGSERILPRDTVKDKDYVIVAKWEEKQN